MISFVSGMPFNETASSVLGRNRAAAAAGAEAAVTAGTFASVLADTRAAGQTAKSFANAQAAGKSAKPLVYNLRQCGYFNLADENDEITYNGVTFQCDRKKNRLTLGDVSNEKNCIKVGLSEADLEVMCKAENVGKVSRRDFAVYLTEKKTGATTVATTMMCAAFAGIHVFATGGIGGVHRHGEVTMDASADLQELGHTPVCVVCAGCKQILDIGRTLEYLETMGVPVIGNKTEDFPAFYCPKSGHKVDYAAKDEADIARILKTSLDLGLQGGMLVGNPVPAEYAMDFDYMEGIIGQALAEADEKGVHGKEITPFLLAKVVELTGGESLATNIQLALNNARCASKIAAELARL